MSDTVWQAIIAAAVTVILAYMQFRTKQSVDAKGKEAADAAKGASNAANAAAVQATIAATKVQTVKTDLQSATDATHEKLDELHKLANAQHTAGSVKQDSTDDTLAEMLRAAAGTPLAETLQQIVAKNRADQESKAAQVVAKATEEARGAAK